MMEVQKFLKANGLEELQKQFAIVVTDYPDRVVLNYNQIESPRFVTLVDECRALILRKDTWEVMARSFERFYNIGEGSDPKDGMNVQRIANRFDNDCHLLREFNIGNAIIQEKIDGSLLSFYWDGTQWCVSTRKLAFAEGATTLGRTFKEVFWDALNKSTKLNENGSISLDKDFTYVFELTGPENRVVTPYENNSITLLGARSNKEEYNYRELSKTELDNIADVYGIKRPKEYKVSSYEQLISLVNSFPTMEEGVVILIESLNSDGSHWRIKCKNPKYLAVAHLRDNGNISPKRILSLVMTEEYHEYLRYFEEDKKYFDYVIEEYNKVSDRIDKIFEECRGIKEQKEFALTIIPKAVYSFESGILFALRKNMDIKTAKQGLIKIGAEKIAKTMNLKQKFIDKFHVNVEEEEV